jgi:hypothetical protein
MLKLMMALSAEYQGSIVPMRLGNTVIQGTRAGGGPPGGPPPGRHRRQGHGRITAPQGPSGGVQGPLDGRAVAQAEGLISLPDPPD